MTMCVLLTKSGAFLFSQHVEVDRDELPPAPQFPFGGPPVESYQQPATGYRLLKQVVTTQAELFEFLPAAIRSMPSNHTLDKSAGAMGPRIQQQLVPGEKWVAISRLDVGYIVSTTIRKKKANAKDPTMRVVKRQVEGGGLAYEFFSTSQIAAGIQVGQVEPNPDNYAFARPADVVSFLREHLKLIEDPEKAGRQPLAP